MFAAPAGIGGSFPTKTAALNLVRESIHEIGGSVVNMTKKEIDFLSKQFNYPDGRSVYLSTEPILKEKDI